MTKYFKLPSCGVAISKLVHCIGFSIVEQPTRGDDKKAPPSGSSSYEDRLLEPVAGSCTIERPTALSFLVKCHRNWPFLYLAAVWRKLQRMLNAENLGHFSQCGSLLVTRRGLM